MPASNPFSTSSCVAARSPSSLSAAAAAAAPLLGRTGGISSRRGPQPPTDCPPCHHFPPPPPPPSSAGLTSWGEISSLQGPRPLADCPPRHRSAPPPPPSSAGWTSRGGFPRDGRLSRWRIFLPTIALRRRRPPPRPGGLPGGRCTDTNSIPPFRRGARLFQKERQLVTRHCKSEATDRRAVKIAHHTALSYARTRPPRSSSLLRSTKAAAGVREGSRLAAACGISASATSSSSPSTLHRYAAAPAFCSTQRDETHNN